MIAHGFAFFANTRLPWASAIPCLGCLLGSVIARFCEPIGPLPSIISAHLTAKRHNLVMDRRELFIASCRPSVPRKMHSVFVAINLFALGNTILMVRVIRVTAWITGPHVPFGLSLCDPFGQDFTRASALCDTKGKDTSLKGIGYPWHRADQWQSIGGIRDGPIDDLRDAPLTQEGHSGERVFDIPFKPIQIIGIKLKAEIFG